MPETPESHKDHCNLEVLNDATLLHNTRRRFNEDNIYTYISEILLIINPFKKIKPGDGPQDLYGARARPRGRGRG